LRGGIKTVLIPEENVKDLQEIPENVKSGLEIVPVKWIDKVLEVALERHPTPLPDDEPAVAAVEAAARGAAGRGCRQTLKICDARGLKQWSKIRYNLRLETRE
jgi:ATP-dependent Lon protease